MLYVLSDVAHLNVHALAEPDGRALKVDDLWSGGRNRAVLSSCGTVNIVNYCKRAQPHYCFEIISSRKDAISIQFDCIISEKHPRYINRVNRNLQLR